MTVTKISMGNVSWVPQLVLVVTVIIPFTTGVQFLGAVMDVALVPNACVIGLALHSFIF